MKLSKRKQLVLKKQQLLTNIQQQRNTLSATSEHWLTITASYDRTWQKMLVFKPLLIASFSLIALYNIRTLSTQSTSYRCLEDSKNYTNIYSQKKT
ncbi:YqjK-like family protein [Arsenophonus endosymbiont of Aleurodicus floccissimus]|uniref:YqjK-like family protein n=1 Tax=Arsenophonus endosymbiont of Aleurodicus floccissimus TaxID=2152761 RepID=UPI000E6AEEDF|nr:YqjK-like family protein [Arsenophonus endosymbiont of Aleurodicus floccissimus]